MIEGVIGFLIFKLSHKIIAVIASLFCVLSFGWEAFRRKLLSSSDKEITRKGKKNFYR